MGIFKRKPKTEQITEQKRAIKAQEVFEKGMASVKDLIAPSAVQINYDFLRIGDKYVKTLFVYAYPRYIHTEWLAPIIGLEETMDISMYVYPVESKIVMENLRKRVGQMEASIMITREKGVVRDPALEAALADAEELRDKLQTGTERFFRYALYFTFYADSIEKLEDLIKKLESVLGGKLIYTKPAHFQMEEAFDATLPLCDDKLYITRNMDTSSLSTTFPFTSSELTLNEGILYGINRHNNTLILFDRFKLENANSVIFAKAGAGKSYAVKLEALRYLMLGVDVIVIDPENEYKPLCEAAGGSYIDISLKSNYRLNPFDLPKISEEEKEDPLKTNIIMLQGLLNLMLGGLSPEEDAILDRALIETYALKDITSDPQTHTNPPPTLEDLYNVLTNIEGSQSLLVRLKKYVKGTFSGIFSQPTNVNLDNQFIVFGVRNLEDQLRPIAMYIILDYVWSRIKAKLKKRIMIVDEAWHLMQYEDSARFLYSLAKRARKYYLGFTTITQDVDDFLNSQYGKAIVTNSSLQLLMRQSPAAIDLVADVFKLTEGEKYMLLECGIGDGLFFAGLNHVAIKVMASYSEHQLITTSPKEILEIQKAKREMGTEEIPDQPIPEAEKPTAGEYGQIQPSPQTPTSSEKVPPQEEPRY
jgi:type IV secretory pathway VirB4 component